ncbi:MAG TPA: ABC transporter permease [Bacteroidales bacterium]|nr:ABC transporter permease [Bacteroidales bacterium]HPF02034.1 ABC transporter permease [Bacteroidales bacterium]HPJ59777.1 ABC transporter permease [Bacteroidales bacterium]HPR12550.1 ABC transporter permease [Bacteroidales bacterium]HRW85233.1 ABC transporter permease [Bacteroidales bacterium]
MQIEESVRIAINGLRDHKFRSLLTMLGIIFGTASVIAMISIGDGARKQAMAKYQDLGVSNIIIRDKDLTDADLETVRTKFSQGLSLGDTKAIREIVPGVQGIAPQSEAKLDAMFEDKSSKATLIGITPEMAEILNYRMDKGTFIREDQYDRILKVCVLGANIAHELFNYEEPLGKNIKLGDQWFEVTGVLKKKALFTETIGELAARDLNNDVYIPLSTFSKRIPKTNDLASELKQVTVRLESSGNLVATSEIIGNILKRRHFDNDDFSIIIPYELMEQEKRESRIYNLLLASIAAISLIVGGIGIMNIMLASVLERTQEIGIRRAVGGRRSDIMGQFVAEAVAMSLTGGIIGVVLGIIISLGIGLLTDVKTSLTLYSIFIAFGFSVLVGITFGYLPAKRAADLKPIESIRHE